MKQPKRKGPKFRKNQVVVKKYLVGVYFLVAERIFVGGPDGDGGWEYAGPELSEWNEEHDLRPLNAKEVGPGWRRKERGG